MLAATALLTPFGLAMPGIADAATSTAATFVDFAQCSNDPPPSTSTACPGGWINGALQGSNSHYRENQATAQRAMVSVPAGGSGPSKPHTMTFSYQTRKDSASAHAYDSLTTWDLTQTTADRCQGFKAGVCPGGSASTRPIPADPTAVTPAGAGISAVTSGHSIPGVMTMYGGTLTAVSTPSHSNPTSGTGDDYATITVTYTVPASRGAQNVQLLFGGHLASSATSDTGWGTGFGAANISGGPYHIKFTMIDGSSAGSRDNQIQAAAILPLAPAFTITKSASPTTTTPGATVTYTITVTNNGSGSGSTTFTDVYDSRVTILTVPTGCTNDAAAHTLTCTTGTIAAGANQVFTYTARMPASFTGASGGGGCPAGQYPVVNTATLSGGGSASSTVCVAAAPIFAVAKSASPSPAAAGSVVTYTVTVTNNGNASGSTTVTDVYDSRITILSVPTGCTNNAAAHTLTCTTGTIAAGANQVFTYTARMPASFTGASGGGGCSTGQYPVINTATLTGGASDSETVCVTAAPVFAINKAASPSSTTPGATVTYTLTVTNNGNASGSTTVTDVYDSRITILSVPTGCTNDATAHTLTCTTGTIAAGANQAFNYTARMPASFTGTSGGGGCSTGQYPVINTATLTGGASDSETVCVTAAPVFAINKAASPTTTTPGATVTYTLTVTNNGNASGSTTVTDVYDSRVTILGAPPACVDDSATHTLTCTTAILDAGQSEVFTYTARMPASFTGTSGGGGCATGQYPVINTATLTGGASDSETVCVNAPVLSITKAASCTETAVPGGFFSYTITVTNTGGATAGSVTLTDTLPTNTTVAHAGGGNFSSPSGPVTWSLGDLAPAASASRTLVVLIDPAANGSTITNVAVASAPGVPSATATFPVTVIDVISGTRRASAGGRAFGVQANLLDLVPIPATPDTTNTNPDTLLALDSPAPAAGVLHLGVMSVDNSKSVTAAQASDTATATTANLRLAVPAVGAPITISASTLVARSQSHASALTSGSSLGGSTVQNLVINGVTYGNINTPTTIDVRDPLTGSLQGHVYVLENVGTGAAQPTAQPEGTSPTQAFNSGLSVNALHVSLNVAGTKTDVVVAHADSTASFPAGLGCQPFPSVRGDAYVLDTPNLNPPLGEVKNGLVTLPSTGGTVDSAIADLSPLGTGTGLTHVDGAITLLPTTAQSHSRATLNALSLLSGAITATTVRSTSDTVGSSSTGSTTIERLMIGGTDICALLNLSTVCSPAENQVLLIDNNTLLVQLRETIRGGNSSEMRVNAVHIYVVGKDNPLGLPVGAEIVLSSSFSGVRLP